MKWQELESQATEIRQSLLGVMEQLDSEKKAWSLSDPPTGYQRAQAALANPEYDVVVCGEAKRGKSTLINALIGRQLLPTGVNETTSQVFRIASAEEESFALVFEDGCREPISKDELIKYGSQVAANLEGMPLFRGRVLRWIEVNTPAVFLPDGVRLVDTPGLGALYASHSEVTNRYITRADAFIFVLDSSQPLTQQELRFLEKAFAVTPNALFVQTKIDQHEETVWQTLRQRNEQLLNKSFAQEGRPPIRVFPVSSTLLFHAAQESDKSERAYLLADSLFEQARAALDVVIYRAVGWTRSAWAVAEAARYIHSSKQNLDEQRQMVAADSAAEKAAMRQKKADIRAKFQREWGPGGEKRSKYTMEVENILRGVRQSAFNIGMPGTDVHNRFMKEINALGSREAVSSYAAEQPDKVQMAFDQEWRETILSAQNMLTKLDEHMPIVADGLRPLDLNLPRLNLKSASVWDRIKATNIDGMIGGGLAALVADIFLTGGLVTLLTVSGAVLGGAQGYIKITTSQLEAARNEIKQHLNTLLAQCRHALCNPDLPHGRSEARLDSFLSNMRSRVDANISDQFKTQQRRQEEEEHKLDQQAELTGQRRDEELQTLQKRIGAMHQLDEQVSNAIARMRELQVVLDQMES